MKRRRAGFGKEKRGMGENARQRQLKGNDNVNGRRERRLSGDAIRAALRYGASRRWFLSWLKPRPTKHFAQPSRVGRD